MRKKPVPPSTSQRSVGAHVSSAGGPSNAITNIENIGGNCFQIFAGSPRMWRRSLYSQKEVQHFNQLVKEKHLDPVFIHALYLVNLASDSPDLLAKSRTALLFDLQNGDQINSAGVIVHLGSHQGRGFAPVKDQIIAEINYLLDRSQTTPFLIENSAGQKGKIGTLEEIASLLESLPNSRVQVCLDTAHLFEMGWNLSQPEQVDLLVNKLESLTILVRTTCLHLNDSKTPLASAHDQHQNLGEGHIDPKGLSHFITHPKLNHLPLILEVPGFDGKGPDSQNISLAKSLTL